MLIFGLILAFGLELVTLVALGLWGVSFGLTLASRVVLGVGTPLPVAVFWGTFLSPEATVLLSLPSQLSLKLAVFASATAALFATGRPVAGIVFISVAVAVTLGLHLTPGVARSG